MKKFTIILMLTAFIMVAVGCSTLSGNYSFITSQDIDLGRFSEYIVREETVSAGKSKFGFAFLWGSSPIKSEEVMQQLLKKQPGAIALTDAEFEYRSANIPILFFYNRYKLSGKLLIDPTANTKFTVISNKY
jgi:hypothetical protein